MRIIRDEDALAGVAVSRVSTLDFGGSARVRFLRAIDSTWWSVVEDPSLRASLPPGMEKRVYTVHRDDVIVVGAP